MTGLLAADNPFASPSTLPHGLPPFERIETAHFAPAINAGFAEHLEEIAAITATHEPATFTNTIEALERSGQLLGRVLDVFFALTSSDATDDIEALEEEYAPRIAAHSDSISLNTALYDRIRAVYEQRHELELTDEQRYLVERIEFEYRLEGAALDESGKSRLQELNQRLATLDSQFVRNLLGDTNDLAVVVDDLDELAGLADSEIASAAEAAKEVGRDGQYRITLPLYTGHPWLAHLKNRQLRERIHTASMARGIRGGEHDNTQIVLESVRLRAERAELLGFASHAELVAANSTAGSVASIDERLSTLATPALRNAAAELEVLQHLADEQQRARDEATFDLKAWDWAFYAEQVRTRDYQVNEAELRPYFEAERVLQDGVFFAANLVYGLTFAPREDLVGYHPDTRIFEVSDADGSTLGLYILDLYTRDVKRGGAWMSTFRQQNSLTDETTVVFNVLNVPKPPRDAPPLLTIDELETLFHEFGHALHALLAHVTYPHFGGTNVLRDFVEFPSQVNEMWLTHPTVLENYARHYETGEPLPREQAEKLIAARGFNQGFMTTEYLAASVLDMAWHRLSAQEAAAVTDVRQFEEDALADAGLLVKTVPTRYSSTYFQHIFGGGYSAGYYGYIWSEVFDAASVEAFEAAEDIRATGERFRQAILAPGGSRKPQDLVHEFLGKHPSIEPLLRRRGLDQ